MTLRKLLLLGFFFFVVVPILYFGYFFYNDTYEELTHLNREKIEMIGQLEAKRISDMIRMSRLWFKEMLMRTKLSTFLKEYDSKGNKESIDDINAIIRDAKEAYLSIENIYIIDREGKVVTSINPEDKLKKTTLNDLLAEAKRGANIYVNIEKKQPEKLYFSGPLEQDGEFLGILVVATSLNPITNFLNDYKILGKSGELILTEKNEGDDKQTLLSKSGPLLSNDEVERLENFVSTLLPGTIDQVVDYKGKTVAATVQELTEKPWRIVIKMDHDEIFASLKELYAAFFLQALFLVGGLLVLTQLFTQKVTRPLRIFRDNIEKIAKSGDLTQEVAVPNEPEISSLGTAFNTLTKKLSHSMVSIEKLKKEAEIRKRAEEEAQKANQLKSEFLAIVSHEIRTPLNSLLGLGELLEDSNLTKEQQETVSSIRNASEQLLKIICDILDFSKIRAGEMQIEKVPFDLFEAVDQAIELVSVAAVKKELNLSSNIDKRVPQYIYGDPLRLKQVLINLLSNAIKFTEKGEVKLFLSLDEKASKLLFSVNDTGEGITKNDLTKLFKAFSQGTASPMLKGMGTGLGLVISKNLVEKMGGTIKVESELGKGSTFLFDMEMRQVPDEAVAKIERPHIKRATLKNLSASYSNELINSMKKNGRETITILAVDDQMTNLEVLNRFLIKAGITCDLERSGKKALEKALENEYDMVILDCQMPGIDGCTLAKMLRDRGKSLPIIALTANVEFEVRKKCLEAGMNEVLSKPISSPALYKTIERLLFPENRSERAEQELENEPLITSFDRAQFMESLENDEEIGRKILGLFIDEDLPMIESDLRRAIVERDLEGVRAAGHALKGGAASLFAHKLSMIGASIESCNDFDKVTSLIKKLKTAKMEFLEITKNQAW